MKLMIGKIFINTEDSIPLVVITYKTVNSFVKDYHAHKDLWKPFINEELTTAMEPDNANDNYPNFVKKNDIIVGHLPHGKNGRFAKMIFYFLRAHKYAECKVKITGRKLILVMVREYKCLVCWSFWNRKYVTNTLSTYSKLIERSLITFLPITQPTIWCFEFCNTQCFSEFQGFLF